MVVPKSPVRLHAPRRQSSGKATGCPGKQGEVLSARQRFGSRWTSSGSSSWCSGLSSARSSLGAMAPGTSSMMRARRRDVSVKPNRRLDRSSTRGMIYENEELRLRTINISAEVERSQDDVKKLRRENDQLRRELWGLRDEYDKLEALLKEKEQGGESEEYSDEEEGEDVEEEEEDAEEEGDEDQGGDGGGLGVEEGKPTPQDGSAAAAPAAQGGAAYRERQVDFDMLSVVQEETENDQTDSLTGGEDQSVSPVIPRKKGVCFLLEPLPEHQAPEQEAPHAEQPAQLVCDQYLLSADGKPLRGPAGKFATTADLAQDPFQYPEAYGYATGTVVGGVLIPAVDPATGLPFTGLFQPPADVYLDASSDAARVNGEAALGFDGLLLAADAAAMAPVERAASPLWTQQQDGVDVATLQPRGAPDVFVEGAYAATTQTEAPAAGNIAQLLRNINLGVAEAPGRADGEAAEDRGGPGGGVVVALRGVPADVPDSEVLAALSQLGTVVGGIRRLGGPRDGGAAGDGDPGGGEGQDPGQGLGQGDDGEERLARLLLWPQCAQRTLPQHIGVAGVLAEIRHLSDQEAALVNLGEFEARAEDMREKSLNAANDKPFRSQIQVRLRHPAPARGARPAVAASPPPGRRAVATLPLRGRPLCALAPAIANAPQPVPDPTPAPATGPQQGLRPRLFGPTGAVQPHFIPGYHTGTLRRPSTPFPMAVLRAPLAQHVAGRAGPSGHALSGADLPVVAMPMPLVAVKNGRPVLPGEVPVVLPVATPTSSAATTLVPALVASTASTEAAATTPTPATGGVTPAAPAGPKHGLQPQDSLGSTSSVSIDPVAPECGGDRADRSQTSESRLEAPNSLRSLPASPAASPAPSRRATHGKRLLRKQSSAQSLEEPATNGTALSASPGTRRKAAKNKGHSHGQTDPGTPGAASSSGSTAATGPGTPVGKHPGGRHAGDVSQSSSSGQESPNKSERRRRVSILSRKPRRAASPTDAILPAEHAEHTTTASERERTNSASSRDSHVSVWRAAAQSGRRRLSSLRRGSAEREAARDAARDAGKVPWCGCWGNGCL